MKGRYHQVFWARIAILSALCTLFDMGTGSAHGEVWPEVSIPEIGKGGERDSVLIVAVEKYQHLPPVPGALKVATDWEAYFTKTLGVKRVTILRDSDAQEYKVKAAAKQLAEKADPEGTVWVVFVGHGAPSPDQSDGLLVTVGAEASVDALEARSVRRTELIGLLESGKQKRTVLVLDACFSGTYDGKDKSIIKGLQPMVLVNAPVVQGALLVLSAGKSNQFAGPLPDHDRPAFSYLLLRALSGEADANQDGQIVAAEAMAYAGQTLDNTRARLGRDQEPELLPEAHADWVLTRDVDPNRGCTPGMTRTTDTQGQCCWPGQSWSKTRAACIGQPTSCPSTLAILAETCGTCPPGTQRDGFTCTSLTPELSLIPPTGSSTATWGWISLATGTAAAITGGVFMGLASALDQEITDSSTSDLTQAQVSSKQSERDTYQITGITAVSIGSAAALTGILLLLFDDSSEPRAGVHFSIDPERISLGISGHF